MSAAQTRASSEPSIKRMGSSVAPPLIARTVVKTKPRDFEQPFPVISDSISSVPKPAGSQRVKDSSCFPTTPDVSGQLRLDLAKFQRTSTRSATVSSAGRVDVIYARYSSELQ